jgi:hypothetical protein
MDEIRRKIGGEGGRRSGPSRHDHFSGLARAASSLYRRVANYLDHHRPGLCRQPAVSEELGAFTVTAAEFAPSRRCLPSHDVASATGGGA